MTKNYLIFIEKSTFNSDLTTLNIERIKFLKNYIMMQEFKYKFLIILEKDLLPIKTVNYLNLENIILHFFRVQQFFFSILYFLFQPTSMFYHIY